MDGRWVEQVDMRIPVHRKNRRIWPTNERADNPGSIAHRPYEPRGSLDVEAWDKTDRQLSHQTIHRLPGSSIRAPHGDPARSRWLEENDVHTQFVDAGIGCSWFAQQGDQEPVSGETEDEAIARLARETGLELWREG